MKKLCFTIYAECIEENCVHNSKLGEVLTLGKIKSEGLAYTACKAIQETMKHFKVYYK